MLPKTDALATSVQAIANPPLAVVLQEPRFSQHPSAQVPAAASVPMPVIATPPTVESVPCAYAGESVRAGADQHAKPPSAPCAALPWPLAPPSGTTLALPISLPGFGGLPAWGPALFSCSLPAWLPATPQGPQIALATPNYPAPVASLASSSQANGAPVLAGLPTILAGGQQLPSVIPASLVSEMQRMVAQLQVRWVLSQLIGHLANQV